MNPDQLKGLAEVFRALAWPLVAVWVGVVYRSDISALLKRLRKGGPAEFDPPSQIAGPNASATTATAISLAASDAISTFPASPSTKSWERTLLDSEPMKHATTAAEREHVLVRIAARAILVSIFESTEGGIWASQLALLDALNRQRAGMPLPQAKEHFYDRAADRFPDVFAKYSFGEYLGFLSRFGLLIVDNVVTRVSDQGIEYLAWRIEQAKAPKTFG